ncbi:MAG: DUF4864 domain-containing protein [Porticoccus sp.]|nr:DUF4864 domain-containing protein [Porticoccus sp.]MBQ0807437.1 DUF4864 domain-containing protein [Porticoccus sp.]
MTHLRPFRVFSAGVIAMSVVLFSATSVFAAEEVDEVDVTAVRFVIDSQISAFKSGDHQSAYGFAAPNVQQAFPSVDVFIDMVRRGYMPIYQPASYFFGRNMLSEGEVYQELIVTDADRKLWQIIYTLIQQEDKSWKVTNVLMYPYKGTAA